VFRRPLGLLVDGDLGENGESPPTFGCELVEEHALAQVLGVLAELLAHLFLGFFELALEEVCVAHEVDVFGLDVLRVQELASGAIRAVELLVVSLAGLGFVVIVHVLFVLQLEGSMRK